MIPYAISIKYMIAGYSIILLSWQFTWQVISCAGKISSET